jgi:hypothetical protein
MEFEWDEIKYQTNIEKHGIRFEDAVSVFLDPAGVEMKDVDSTDEERFLLLGHSHSRGLLVVVYCERHGDTIRIISARKATRNERGNYER